MCMYHYKPLHKQNLDREGFSEVKTITYKGNAFFLTSPFTKETGKWTAIGQEIASLLNKKHICLS